MFAFIAGLQPHVKKLGPTSQSCPACGAGLMDMQRVDYFFSIFFIPLFPVKKGKPHLVCRQCSTTFNNWGEPGPSSQSSDQTCPACRRVLRSDPDYEFCPYCGEPLHGRNLNFLK